MFSTTDFTPLTVSPELRVTFQGLIDPLQGFNLRLVMQPSLIGGSTVFDRPLLHADTLHTQQRIPLLPITISTPSCLNHLKSLGMDADRRSSYSVQKNKPHASRSSFAADVSIRLQDARVPGQTVDICRVTRHRIISRLTHNTPLVQVRAQRLEQRLTTRGRVCTEILAAEPC